MDKPSIVIREGVPEYQQGLLCGRYLNQASEGFFRFMLGKNYEHIVATAYIHTNHSYSYQNAAFAEYNGGIAGMALGFSATQYQQFTEAPINREAARCYWRMKAVKILCAPILRIIETIDQGDFYLLALAVDEEYRGKGLASVLMASVRQRAMANHCSRLALDVAAGNANAVEIYQNWGMAIESRWPRKINLKKFGFYRMVDLVSSGQNDADSN